MNNLTRAVLATVIDTECLPENMTRRNFRTTMESECEELIDATTIGEVGNFLDLIHEYCKTRDEQGAVLTQLDHNDILALSEDKETA